MRKPIAPKYIMICNYMDTDNPAIYYLKDDLAVEMQYNRVINGKGSEGGKQLMNIITTGIIEREDFNY